MSAQALLARLNQSGVRLSLSGNDIRFQTRPGASIAPHVELIREHKQALVACLLNREPVEATTPPVGWDCTTCPGCNWPALCTVLGPRGPHMAGGPCPSWPALAAEVEGVA